MKQESRLQGAITKIKFSQDQSFVVSVRSEGAIFIWAIPQDVQDAQVNKEMLAGHDEKSSSYSNIDYSIHKILLFQYWNI